MSTYRNELKFICTEKELALIEGRIRMIMEKDSHIGDGKPYTVRSVYFDDYENSCMNENQNGIARRTKFRIRTYNHDISCIRLEIKSKQYELGKKNSCFLSEEECKQYLHTMPEVITKELPHARRRLSLEIGIRKLHPVIIVEYERMAYVYSHGNVRITFDRNISMCAKPEQFLKTYIPLTPIMPKGIHILEVKFDEFLPDVIAALLETGALERTSFSKYCLSRQMEEQWERRNIF